MDGYTFMIERNRRFIQFEATRQTEPGEAKPGAAARQAEADLQREVAALYQALEGCGRGAGTETPRQ